MCTPAWGHFHNTAGSESGLVCTGGHIVHLGSALGQLDSLPLPKYKEKIRSAKTIQEIMDLPYPAQEIAEVRSLSALECTTDGQVATGLSVQVLFAGPGLMSS